MDSLRELLLGMNLERKENYWEEEVNTEHYLRNRLSSTSCVQNFTPHETIHGKASNISNKKVFGCEAFIEIEKHNRDGKFSSREIGGIFVGCGAGKAFRIFIPSEGKIHISRDVIFN